MLPSLVYRWTPNQSRRFLPVRLVVVHRPVGSYRSAVEVLCQPGHEASAHIVVREDGREATQLVPWQKKAWACVKFNSMSDNIETPDWIWEPGPLTEVRHGVSREFVMRQCARMVAFRLHKRGLPAKWCGRTGKGFLRHYDLGSAGGGHTDPTLDRHRWLQFVEMVRAETARGGFRKTWGRET